MPKLQSRLPIFLTAISSGLLSAQSQFPGFTSGNVVVSRTVYSGDATTIHIGQALPPVCPASAKCGTAATANGSYPSTTNANNVFDNNKADGSFGITTPIFLDQITPAGALVNTLAIPPNMVNTSFSSKSELAINLSDDGSALTFMAYIAPSNAIDVSNSNTPGVYDGTNPAGASYFRSVVQVGANGAIQVTPINAYSGNNGRAAFLAGGLYYMVGNSNNGTGTPDNVINATGLEIASPGQSATTPPQMIGNFSIAQINDPSTGKPYAADKAGKDNNFRGLTVFNNTVYFTKGSGGNGINTVYQAGATGTLPTVTTAAATPITILPGFPTVLAKTTTPSSLFPFGIWFANATTLYVADEGDGVAADAATAPNAGLQKWSLVNGTWQLDYVLQKGLNLGQPYTIANYPAALNPATDGLRNITGKVNSDGTVTIWGVTSTVSVNGDQGADPNKLVMITDTLANLTPAGAANEQFTTLRTANAGEVLRGVSLAPTKASNMANVPLIISLANPGAQTIAPGSLVAARGQNLAIGYPGPIFGILPLTFDATSVSIVDSKGATTAAPMFYVSPNEVDFQLPANVAPGAAKVLITSNGVTQTASNVQIAAATPGLFTLNNAGLATAYAVRVSSSGVQSAQQIYALDPAGSVVASPISMGSTGDQVYLILYGSGIAGAGTANTQVTVNGLNATVLYAGPQGGSPGLDQVNILLPATLAGKGNVNLQLSANGVPANSVQITVQ
jgi:uncharacterized protein (TIGR03437 family)